LALVACAAYPDEPASSLEKWLETYKKDGVEAGLEVLVKGGPLEGSKEVMAHSNTLRTIEAFYGSYESYDIFHETRIGQRCTMIFFVMNYEGGPVFGTTTNYMSDGAWIVANFKFNTEINQVWPSEVLFADD
jgi:hypothetical protein